MISEKYYLETEMIASDDGQNTYEIKRTWGNEGRKGLVLELYPTLAVDRCGELDLSTMHLMNHVKDFGWSSVRIINLYSKVFASKPLASQLEMDEKNIAYIEDILEADDIEEYDIVIATGSSLSTHAKTIETKLDILHMLKDKKLEAQVKCIIPEYVEENAVQGTHPLFLGLHHAKEQWSLENYNITDAIAELEGYLKERESKRLIANISAEKEEKKGKKEKKKDVLQNQESA